MTFTAPPGFADFRRLLGFFSFSSLRWIGGDTVTSASVAVLELESFSAIYEGTSFSFILFHLLSFAYFCFCLLLFVYFLNILERSHSPGCRRC